MTDFEVDYGLFSDKIVIEHIPQRTKMTRALVYFDERPLTADSNPLTDPDCYETNGQYAIRYAEMGLYENKLYKKKLRFMINVDFVHKRWFSVAHWDHFVYLAKKDPVVRWLKENTNISKELFDIAAHNSQISIPFCLDVVKYLHKLNQWGLHSRSIQYRKEHNIKEEINDGDLSGMGKK